MGIEIQAIASGGQADALDEGRAFGGARHFQGDADGAALDDPDSGRAGVGPGRLARLGPGDLPGRPAGGQVAQELQAGRAAEQFLFSFAVEDGNDVAVGVQLDRIPLVFQRRFGDFEDGRRRGRGRAGPDVEDLKAHRRHIR